MIEIRDYRDGKTIVVYTDDNTVVTKLNNRTQLIKTQDYTKEEELVGKDLYFPKSQLRSICRALGYKLNKNFTPREFRQIEI